MKKKTDIEFRDIIYLVDESVKSGKIKKDYQDYLSFCKKNGISSYVLNTLIKLANDEVASVMSDTLDKDYFVIDENIVLQNQKNHEQQKILRQKEKIAMLDKMLSESRNECFRLSTELKTAEEKVKDIKNKRKLKVLPYWIIIVILLVATGVAFYVIYSDPLMSFKIQNLFYL